MRINSWFNCPNLIHFKDKIYLYYHRHEINEYIFKDYSFDNEQFKYNLEFVKTYFYYSIRFMKQFIYSPDTFFIESPNSKDITIVKFENSEISKLDQLIATKGKILSIIDNSNGDIILIKKYRKIKTMNIFSKNENKYYLLKAIKNEYFILYNIISNIFMACSDIKSDIYGLSENKYIIKKTFKGFFEFLGRMNDKYFIIKDENYLYIIDLIYFEILQKICFQNNCCLFHLRNNLLLQITKINDFKIKIQIKKFEFFEGCFKVYESKEKNSICNKY